tara:strand:- start:5130 stop:5948 length:819 start_codon:yes stop_codon:yes gene_type:complete
MTSIANSENISILNIFLVDKTGSMNCCAQQTVSGFKEFKDNMKKNSDPNISVEYALGLFDVKCDLHKYKTLEEMPDLVLAKDYEVNNKNHLLYQPDNMTALYDALHVIFEKWGHLKNCVLAIFTDGQSNSDIVSNKNKIFKQIRKLEKENHWMFHYFGANVDAYEGGRDIGITNTTQCDVGDMSSVFRGVSYNMSQMTRSQSQRIRHVSAPPQLMTVTQPTLTPPTLDREQRAPFEDELNGLLPSQLVRQQAQLFHHGEESQSENDVLSSNY